MTSTSHTTINPATPPLNGYGQIASRLAPDAGTVYAMVMIGRAVLIAGALSTFAGVSVAHPGGTDRYGCHVDSSTGLRHCHNGEGRSQLETIFAAEIGASVGYGLHVEGREQLDAVFIVDVQHDGSMYFTAGVAVDHDLTEAGHGLYFDLTAGLAWIARHDAYASLRMSGGLKLPIVRIGQRSSIDALLGGFLELVADGANAEPAGIHLTLAVTL